MSDTEILKKNLSRLQVLHQEREHLLSSLMLVTIPNHLEIQRLKKSKLDLKDQIEALKSRLLPDIIA